MKIIRIVLCLAITCVIVMAGFALFQDRLLYFPERAAVADVVSGTLHAWPSREAYRGLVAEPAGRVRGTVVVFHGNAGHAGGRSYYATELTRLGLRVILAEYPGYGPRNGTPNERSLAADAQQTIEIARRRYGAPLLVVGESLGTGVAAEAVSRERDKIAGLMLITPWDTLEHVAAYHYPWLPVKWLLRDRYDSAANLAAFGHPVLVVVAERDRTVPARFGAALFDTLADPRRLAVVQSADHGDWAAFVDDAWWRAAIGFLLASSR